MTRLLLWRVAVGSGCVLPTFVLTRRLTYVLYYVYIIVNMLRDNNIIPPSHSLSPAPPRGERESSFSHKTSLSPCNFYRWRDCGRSILHAENSLSVDPKSDTSSRSRVFRRQHDLWPKTRTRGDDGACTPNTHTLWYYISRNTFYNCGHVVANYMFLIRLTGGTRYL